MGNAETKKLVRNPLSFYRIKQKSRIQPALLDDILLDDILLDDTSPA